VKAQEFHNQFHPHPPIHLEHRSFLKKDLQVDYSDPILKPI